MFKSRLLLLALCSLFFFTLNEVSAQQFTKTHAVQHLQKNLVQLGLQPEDISEMKVTDNYTDERTGVTHIYLQQTFQGVPVREGVGSVHFKKSGEPFYSTNKFIPALAEKITNSTITISREQAIRSAASVLDLPITKELKMLPNHKKAKENKIMFSDAGISRRDIPVRQYYEFNQAGELRLVYEAEIYMTTEENWWLMRMDAASGKEISRNNIILHCNFGGGEHVDHEHYHFFADVPKVDMPLSNLNTANKELEKSTVKQQIIDESTTMFGGTYNHFGYKDPVDGHYAAIESPIHVDENAPGDGRVILTGDDIIDVRASPFGWHSDGTNSYTITQGNNVLAYHNPEGTLVSTGTEGIVAVPFFVESGIINGGGNVPDGGDDLEFEYATEINTPNYNSFLPDAITNLFVINNVMHDVTYLYGFNEQSGNFQDNNRGLGGVGDDAVLAGAQANAFVNNASFGTPDEGESGVMKMYIWTTDAPSSIIDGDFDAGVIGHEYGHGVSTRMVGGPSQQCLGGTEQGGEGWSDFEGLMISQKDFNGDGEYGEFVDGEGIRGIGNYVQNQGRAEEGIRLAPYTTNMDPNQNNGIFNDYTYGDQPNVAAPHGVGFIWCSILWDLNWAMINKYGFDFNIYNYNPDVQENDPGNIRTMALVHEAFRYTGCSPSFIDMRDAIFTANEVLYPDDAADDNLMMWEVFARRGLGVSAAEGGNEAFDLPTFAVSKTVNANEKAKGTELTYTINVQNNSLGLLENVEITDELDSRLTFTGSNDGGTANGQTVTFPAFDVPLNGTVSKSFTADIDGTTAHTTSLELHDFEGLADAEFVPAGLWTIVSDETHSGTGAYFHPDPETINAGDLIFNATLPAGTNALSFWQKLGTEGGFDGGVVDISTNAGVTYTDLGSRMIQNGYNSSISGDVLGVPVSAIDGRRAFSGDTPYFQTIIDLSGYSGAVTLRWRFGSDVLVGATGWWIDDVEFLELYTIPNETCVSSTSFPDLQCANLGSLGTIIRDEQFQAPLAVDIINLTATADLENIRLNWTTASESSNKGFEVLRRTAEEEEFSSIAYIKGQGDSNLDTDYQYIDRNAKPNTRYFYQLRAYDNAGKSALTNIVSAIISQDETVVQVYPNPASNLINVNLIGKNINEVVEVEVMDVTGQLVRTLSFDSTAASNFTIDCTDLPEQLYLIRITSGDFVNTQQVMVQR